jgi:prevent-host-death family protein
MMRTKKRVSVARETPSVEWGAGAAGSHEISAGEFKARCLALMDEVSETGGEYIITKRGVPVAKLIPVRVERRPLLGSMKGSLKVHGDIVHALDEPWDALEDRDDES